MTSSFLKLRKPWLQYRSEFEAFPHLKELYDFWVLVWAADTKTKDDIDYWEYEICKGSLSYIQVGLALQTVRSKFACSTRKWQPLFEKFCKDSPYCSANYAKQIIKAAQVAIDLMGRGFTKLPTCVAQALPLAKFCSSIGKNTSNSGDELCQKWQEIIDTAPHNHVTAAHVKSIADNQTEEPKTSVKIDKKFKESLAAEARERGMPVGKLLEEILAERYYQEPSSYQDAAAVSEIPGENPEEPAQDDAASEPDDREEILNELDRCFAEMNGRVDRSAWAINTARSPDSS